MRIIDRHDMTLAVKVALNPQYNQPTIFSFFLNCPENLNDHRARNYVEIICN